MSDIQRPNVLFICLDSLRSDFAVGEFGVQKPFFSMFEQEGTMFDTMISATSTTTPAVATYMTGSYSSRHGIFSLQNFLLNEEATTLAEVFSRNGYSTQAHVTGPISKETDLDRGFDTYQYREKDRTMYTDWWTEFKDELEAIDEPWFTYLHLWETHQPRYPPPDAADDELEYEACVRGASSKLEALMDAVDLDTTIVAVTGDHGESIYDGTLRNRLFLEADRISVPHTAIDTSFGRIHLPIPQEIVSSQTVRRHIYDNYLQPQGIELEDFYNSLRKFRKPEFPSALHRAGHGYQIYDFLTRVPFGIAGAGVPQMGKISDQVRQVDIFPTILSAAGLETPDTEGQNLLTGTIEDHPAFSRACGSTLRSESNWLYGVRHDGWKLIKGLERPLKQLFHIESDPKQIENVIDDYPDKTTELESLLDEFIAQEKSAKQNEIDENRQTVMTERLEDLGYL